MDKSVLLVVERSCCKEKMAASLSFLTVRIFKKKSVKSGKVDSFVRKWVRMVGFVVDDCDVAHVYHGEKCKKN